MLKKSRTRVAEVQGWREGSTLVCAQLMAQVTSSGSAERGFCSGLLGGRSLPMPCPPLFLDQVLWSHGNTRVYCVPRRAESGRIRLLAALVLAVPSWCWQHHQRHRTGCLMPEFSLTSALAQLPRRFTRENGCKCLSIPGPSRHPVVFGRELLATASQAATWSIGHQMLG